LSEIFHGGKNSLIAAAFAVLMPNESSAIMHRAIKKDLKNWYGK